MSKAAPLEKSDSNDLTSKMRDYLTEIGWNKEPPAPELPPDVVRRTSEKYLEALRQLTRE